MTDLGIIILNYNTPALTVDCVKSILNKSWNIQYKIIIVDNASTDGSVVQIKKALPQIELIQNKKNLGFAAGNNIALKKISKYFDYCLLLNSDTLVLDNALDNLIGFIKESDFDIVSCQLLDPDGSFQPNAGGLPTPANVFVWLFGVDDIVNKMFYVPSYQERRRSFYKNGVRVGWVSGSVMMIKSSLIDKIGLLDEKIFMYGEDVEYCWRAAVNGYKTGWTDKAQIIHIGGASSKEAKSKQWKGEFAGLIYLYNRYYGKAAAVLLRLMIRIAVGIRVIAFGVLGNKNYAKTYATIIKKI